MIDEILLEYENFKEIVLAKKLWIQYTKTDETYYIFAYDEIIKYTTVIWRVTNPHAIDAEAEALRLLDFETNYLPEANRPLTQSVTSAMSVFDSGKIEIGEAEETGECSWYVTSEEGLFFTKCLIQVIGAEFGDYIEQEIWTLEEVPQYVKSYGKKYVYGTTLYPWFEGKGSAFIPYGIEIRFVYHKVGTGIRKAIIDVCTEV